MYLNFNEPKGYFEPAYQKTAPAKFDVWKQAKDFHNITKENIVLDENGLFEIWINDCCFWQSSNDCQTLEQAYIEFEDGMFDHYFELEVEHEYNTSLGNEELY